MKAYNFIETKTCEKGLDFNEEEMIRGILK